MLRAGLTADLNYDGLNEFIITFTKYPQLPRTPLEVKVLGFDGNVVADKTTSFLGSNPSKVTHSPWIIFDDVNNDGKNDLVFTDCLDTAPWDGGEVAVALFNGLQYIDQSNIIPDTKLRNYAVAVGNFDGKSGNEIFYGAENNYDNSASLLLSIEESRVNVSSNPIRQWAGRPNLLQNYQTLVGSDIDNDGFDDLLVGGSHWSYSNTVIFGGAAGLDVNNLVRLPASPLGEGGFNWNLQDGVWPPKTLVQGGVTDSIVLDFNNDGLKDIFTFQESATFYPANYIPVSGIENLTASSLNNEGGTVYGDSIFYAIKNLGSRLFAIESQSELSLTSRYYFSYYPFDVNGDNFIDVVANYFTFQRPDEPPGTARVWSTTFFINDRTGNFQPIEGTSILPELVSFAGSGSSILNKPQVGIIAPISLSNGQFYGVQIVPTDESLGEFAVNYFQASDFRNVIYKDDGRISNVLVNYNLQSIAGSPGLRSSTLGE